MSRGVGITPLTGILDVVKHVHFHILRTPSLCILQIFGCTWAEQSIHGYSPVECTKHNPFVRIDEILHIAIDELHPFINMCGFIEMVEL
jgi:hypothetical protein